MRTAAAVLTYNLDELGRRDLFDQTIESLGEVDELFVIDNASTDGTAEFVAAGQWRSYLHSGPNTTIGFGQWTACRVLAASTADVLVLSDDDMAWHDGFTRELCAWWKYAPADLVLTGGHLEPEFPWNTIEALAGYGETKGLFRKSVGSASWTFTQRTFPTLAKIVRRIPIDRPNVWDVPVCHALRDHGYRIGQLDLAEHAGQGRSSWGNGTETLYGWDVAPVRARVR